MKLTCTKENLINALELVNGVATKHANLPILSNIMIVADESKVELVATNLEIAVKVNLRAKVEEGGSFTIPAKTLFDYIRLLSDSQIDLALEGNELVITSGHSSTKLKGMSAEDFPVIPEIEETHGFTILAEAFKDSLSKVLVAVAKNEIRPELSGMYFGFFTERYKGLVLAATDSYRLAEKKVSVAQGEDELTCIVPARTVHEMIRLIGLSSDGETQVRVWVSDSQIAIRYDGFEMTSRLVDGSYPDYAQIIPENFQTISTFPVDVMVNNIKAASLFSTAGVGAVLFDADSNKSVVSVSSTSTQTGEHTSEVDAQISGGNNTILLNHRYVLDGLQQMNESEVEFEINSGDAPCMFKPKGRDNYLYIVMPVRQ